MSWNPFQFKYQARYIKDENEDYAVLELQKGIKHHSIYFPRALLPLDLKAGDEFIFKIEDKDSSKDSEAKTMQKLLENLIH